jgi:glutamate-1-semialdehyde-2,1-aminomutase
VQPIAIVGIGCRFPSANNPQAFWQLLRDGVDAISKVPSERFDVDAYYDSVQGKPGKMNTRWGGFLQQVDRFDPSFFGISPREADRMDPQQRLVLEVAWEALENAGVAPDSLSGTQTGVFIGIGNHDYTRLLCKDLDDIDPYSGTGGTLSIAANRLSYLLNLCGPSLGIETACSSSLVAIHLACQSLRSGESNSIVAGGVNLILSPDMTIAFSQARMMAADGRCKTFDADADGYVRGEGCGIIILKRLDDAIKNRDRILAVIRGSAVNQDGLSNGLTAPNGLAQQEVICQALENAKVAPAQISYVEAHGPGTALGDPIEVNSLKAVLMKERSQDKLCGIGSVKTNIGHLEAAAGIAGLIKVVLQLQHGQIFPHLNLKKLNPYLALEETPFFIPRSCQSWSCSESRLAGVSAFSFGGTNCHVILEEAPKSTAVVNEVDRPLHLLTLSTKSEKALQQLAQSYKLFLEANPELPLADICFTANTGRSHFADRLAIVAESTLQLRQQLNAFVTGKETSRLVRGKKHRQKHPKIAFLFTGQGSQYVGMGRQLYETQPLFRQILDRCNEILRPYLEKPLLEVLYSQEVKESTSCLLDETAYTQPILFAFEYALFELWKSWGIEPAAVMGHSVGEYVAACVAGVLTLEDGLKLIASRASLMQALPQEGEMVAVFADESRVQAAIGPYSQKVSIATINSPENIVISGESLAVKEIAATLEAEGIKVRNLKVSHAFHSPLIEPMLDAFEQTASQISFQAPSLPLISNLTGQILPPEEIPDSKYWRCHARESVKFMTGINTLVEQGYELFLEIGPKPVLSRLGKQCQQHVTATWLPSSIQGKEDWQVLLQSLSVLYVQGVDVNWIGFEQDYSRSRLSLPTYPFQRKRYWIKEADYLMNGKKSDNKVFQSQIDLPSQKIRQETILSNMRFLVAELLQVEPSDIDVHTPFLEMGADSLVLIDLMRAVENAYGLKIATCQLFEELKTLDELATYIDRNLLPERALVDSSPSNFDSERQLKQPEQQLPVVSPQEMGREKSSPEIPLERIMRQQLEIMSQQLEVLRTNQDLSSSQIASGNNGRSSSAYSKAAPQNQLDRGVPSISKLKPKPTSSQSSSPCSPWSVTRMQVREMSSQQKKHLEALIDRYTKRTQTSKQRAQADRPFLADSRAVAGFRPAIKEMLYPIVGERAQGAKFWDIDGNEYIDITMGFGVLLFGHNPPFITKALEEQSKKGIQIGPQSNLAGEVAKSICELTGMERVTFCNSGTEAMMTALRLARTATRRTKIAIFAGSYHGHFDGVLISALPGQTSAVPMTLGVSDRAVEDVLVLDYGDPQSLEILQTHSHELAAVLVEPVQSRRPNLQPKEFLQQLRQWTEAAGVALIFDEVLTGFRIHPGGAQGWFGIEADLVTYGKIVGGGLPIGVVAGKATYMNGIDGGLWNYGDASYPQADKTFFAGTFNKNHLGMAAARAVLKHLREQGSILQQQLNQRTSKLAETLNTYFEAEDVPLKLLCFGSLFRFVSAENIDLFYYHLLEKGIYIWEGRNCFLSTAHTEEDIDYLIQAVKDSVKELQKGGFLSKGSKLPQQEKELGFTSQLLPDYLPTPSEITSQLAPQLNELVVRQDLEAYNEGIVKLEALCITYVLKAFQQMGWEFQLDRHFSTKLIAEQLHVVEPHRQLLNRLLEMLSEEGVLHQVKDQWKVIRVPKIENLSVQEKELLVKYPAVEAELNLLQRCGQALAQVLQGKCNPLQLLFPNGDLSTATKLYQKSPAARVLNTLVQKTLSVALEHLPAERRVRVLEIGAGTGGTTAYILPYLPADRTEYVFTDLSSLFIAKARQQFCNYSFVKYEILDIEQESVAQGFAGDRYDLIVAANVLHATKDLRQTLKHVRQLLAPGGLLVLMEGTACQRWLDLIFGLTEGWWKFSDRDLRRNYPLLSAIQWQEFLKESGFTEVETLPATQDTSDVFPKQTVMVAEAAHRVSLTDAQKQLWVLAQMTDEGSIAYNESISLQLRGSLNLDAMRQAVQKILERHEALRTTIDNQGNFQQILPSLKIDVPSIDFSNADSYEGESQVAKWIEREGRKPFDLSKGPLLRVSILKLEEQLHCLVLTAHHIVVDGWSIDLILQDLGAIYSAGCQGIACQLELPMQFRDYIQWQEQQSQSEKMAADESYWLEQFAGSIPVLELPTDYPRPSLQTYTGDEQSIIIDASCYDELKSLSTQQGCTLFMTLLAGFSLLLSHLSSQDDLVIGISAAGQSSLGHKNLVGYCVNVLPLRFQVKHQTFTDYLTYVKKLFLNAYEHQNYPFGQLLKKLNLQRDPSRSPLITTQFNLDKFGQGLKFFGLEVKASMNSTDATRRDLTWNLAETEGKLLLTCTYNQNLFNSQTIQRWIEQFEVILSTVVKQPNIQLDAIVELLNELDQQKQSQETQNLETTTIGKLKKIRRKGIGHQKIP